MRRMRMLLLAAGILLMLVPMASAAIVLQEDFDGLGGALNGQTVSTVGTAVWEAGDTWLDDGTAGTTVAGSANGQAAHLDFTPEDNKVYTLWARILNDQPNWIAVGFMPASPPGGDWTATDFSVRHSNNGAYAWALTRNSSGNDQESFVGANTGGPTTSTRGDLVDPTDYVDIHIILDTRPDTWTVEYHIDGNGVGDVYNLPGTGNPGIAGVGFSHDRNSSANNGGVIDYLIVDCVPEPGSALLAMVALVGLAGWRRNRR